MSAVKIGTRLGNYEILRLIARGGMGEVYEGYDLVLDRRVALKIIPAESDRDDFNKRFIREARILAKLNHPNIVTIYSIDTVPEPYIAMEYVHGISLREVLTSIRIQPDIVVSVFDQILRAVKTLHDHGIVHRDLKPGNILIRDNGQVKILDLGIAKSRGAMEITDPNITIGTPHYMAPELLDGADASVKSDIWSLGAVMFECLTCEPIVTRLNGGELRISKADHKYIPQSFRYIIGSMAAGKPDDRYKDSGEVIDDFRRLGETIATRKRYAQFRQELRILIDEFRPDSAAPSYAAEHPTLKSSGSLLERTDEPPARAGKKKRKGFLKRLRRSMDFATVAALIVTFLALSYFVYRWATAEHRPTARPAVTKPN